MTHLPQIIIAANIGERFLGKTQGLRCIDRCNLRCLAIGERHGSAGAGYPEHGSWSPARIQSHLDRAQHRLLIML